MFDPGGRAALKLVSSRWTVFYRDIAPLCVLAAVLGLLFLADLSRMENAEGFVHFYLASAAAIVLVYALAVGGVRLDVADEVWDAGDALIVKKGGKIATVEIAALAALSWRHGWTFPLLVLELKSPCELGGAICFLPMVTLLPQTGGDLKDELARRMEEREGGG